MRSRAPLKVKPDAKISEDDLEQIAVSWLSPINLLIVQVFQQNR